MNMIKKVQKAKETGLRDGEQILAAISVNDAGAVAGAAKVGGAAAGFGILGSVFATKSNEKKAKQSAADDNIVESEMSKIAPTGQGFIAVTDTRILFYTFAQMSGNAKDLVGELARNDMQVADVQKGKLATKVVFQFADGGRRAFDVPRLNDLEPFTNVL